MSALTPLGTTITSLTWINVPDKYNPQRGFDRLEKARAYDSSGFIHAELGLSHSDAGSRTVTVHDGERALAGVDPVGAVAVEHDLLLTHAGGRQSCTSLREAESSGLSGYLTERVGFRSTGGELFWLDLGGAVALSRE
ncbi:hypothetical protein GCM10022247_60370 [Allokutzneria multivorans]|uniref:Uncharacterized protein n=1 Tax=Allokutzneria multivorans TaxID=1142134 RepID=A0ABP7TKA2_9PSEU